MGEQKITEPSHPEKGARDRAENQAAYWRANLKLLGKLLAVWFIVSFGFGILLKDLLNQIPFFGFKLGFWFAQQGSIYIFIALIFIYVWRMSKIHSKLSIPLKFKLFKCNILCLRTARGL